MRNAVWWSMLGAALLFAGCASVDDDDDDDAQDDDTQGGDDDDVAQDDDTQGGDDDTSTGAFSCEDLTDEELELLTKVFCAGSSNSYSDGVMGSPPNTAAELSGWYHGKVVEQVMSNLGACVSYEPELWIYWYTEVDEVPADATLTWAIDATFHFLDDDPSEEVFRQRVADYLAILYGPGGLAEDVTFIGANVPEQLMGETGFTGDTAQILQITAEEMARYPNAVMIDLDYYLDRLSQGQVTYDGEVLEKEEIFNDQVHVNDLGHQLLADLVIQEINARWPVLQVPQHADIEILD